MDHLLPAHLKEEKKNVLKAVAIVEVSFIQGVPEWACWCSC